jgi:hypothetical protein
MIRFVLLTTLAMLAACVTSELAEEAPDNASGITLQGGKADAWDKLNDPQRFLRFLDKELEYTLADLPMDGSAVKEPWPETYWPTYQDSTNARWDGMENLSPLEKYDLVFNDWLPPEGFMDLKPYTSSCGASDFDPTYYDAIGPAARWMSENRGNWRAHDGVDSDGDGEIDECDDHDGIDGWWGLCHAWAPAALIEDEPVRAIVHEGITFYPSDLKALMITVYDSSRAVVIGGRCKAEQVERDETGRIVDPDCRDTNAGTFHIITANFLGRFNVGFAEDRTYNHQVWNQPVHAYNVDRIEEVDELQAMRLLGVDTSTTTNYPYNSEAKRWSDVEISMKYVVESHASRMPTGPEFDRYLRTDRYHYILEMDTEGEIIGGEWINGRSTDSQGRFSEQPDFLWYPTGPRSNPIADGPHGPRDPRKNPHVSYSKVLRLFAKATE